MFKPGINIDRYENSNQDRFMINIDWKVKEREREMEK